MKQNLRQRIIDLRENQDATAKSEKEKLIDEKVSNLEVFKKAQTVLLYAAFRGEVSLRELKKKTIQHKTLVLPKVDKSKTQLHLYEIPDLDYLQSGYAGILEAPENLKTITENKIDLAIIPGVAFDTNGNRIGFGQGFYDRLLTQLKCPIIAPAFEFQIVDQVPTEPHDLPVDLIITEQRVINCKH